MRAEVRLPSMLFLVVTSAGGLVAEALGAVADRALPWLLSSAVVAGEYVYTN